MRWVVRAIAASFRPKASLVAEKSLPSTATIGSATKASPAAIEGQRWSFLDTGVSMVPALAKAAFDRDTRNGARMAPTPQPSEVVGWRQSLSLTLHPFRSPPSA